MAREFGKAFLRNYKNQCCTIALGHLRFKPGGSKEALWAQGVYSPCGVAEELRRKGLAQSDAAAFVALLKACAKSKDLCRGITLHDDILQRGLVEKCSDGLVTMYAKCGALGKARELFELYQSRDVLTWNALIGGYAQKGKGHEALSFFDVMKRENLYPDAVTFSCVLKACGIVGVADQGERIHDEIAKQGLLEHDAVLGNALVSMYAKCGALGKAQRVLEELRARDIVSWNALIAGYVQHGEDDRALDCFERMRREGLCPDAVTLNCILIASGNKGAVDKGEQVHDEIIKQGLLKNNILLGTAVVSMYAKCGALTKARRVLEGLPVRNAISWNALMTAYAQHGENEKVLECFEEMRREGLAPDAVTFICILKACCSLGAIGKGERIHDEISKQGLLRDNILLGTALVDMYAKCCALTKARQVLGELPARDAIAWNALIAGSGQLGEGKQALDFFKQMESDGISPDATTFCCVLSACNRLGLVGNGRTYFADMSAQYGLKPELRHYTSMVVLFGCTGNLDMAASLMDRMASFDGVVWSALLGACLKWGDLNGGQWAFGCAVRADKLDMATYLPMADNIYVSADSIT